MIHPGVKDTDLIMQKGTWRGTAPAGYDTSAIDSFWRGATQVDDVDVTCRTGSTLSIVEKAVALRALHEEIQ
jgi:hypothetical protein